MTTLIAPEEPDVDLEPPASTLQVVRARLTGFGVVSTIISLAAVALVIYPLVQTILRVFHPGGHWTTANAGAVFHSPWFWDAIRDTAITVALAGTAALLIGLFLAWCNERTDANFGLLGEVLPLLPLLLPPIALAVGWTMLGLPRIGFINVFLQDVVGHGHINIETWAGLIWVETLRFVPFVYLIAASAFRNSDPSLEEAARTCGSSIPRTLWRVSIPAIRPAIAGAALLVVIEGLADYSIPRILAPNAHVDILSVRIVRLLTVTYPPQTAQAVTLSGLLFAVIIMTWLAQRRVTSAGNFATVGGRGQGFGRWRLGPWKWVARIMMVGYLVCASLGPFLAVVLVSLQPFWSPHITLSRLTFRHYQTVLNSPFDVGGIRNSLLLGASGALIGLGAATIMALYIARGPGVLSRLTDTVSKLPAAFSSIVLGVGFLFAFSGKPFNLSGTVTLLLLAYLVIHLPQASIVAGSSVAQVGRALAEAAWISGASEGRTVRRILLPLMLPGLVAGAALLFVLNAGELSASSLLAGVGTPVVGLVIVQIWDSGSYAQLTSLTAMFGAACIVVVCLAMLVSRLLQRRWR